MSWIKVSAKTVADALMEASIQLGTSSDNIEYHVLEQGSAGFLGLIGAKKAVIEAKKKKTDEDLMKEVFGDLKETLKEDILKEEPQSPEKQPEEQPRSGSSKESRKESRKEPKKEARKEKREQPEKKEAAPVRESGRDGRKEFRKEEAASRVPEEGQTAKESGAQSSGKEKDFAREGGRNSRGGRRNSKRQKEGENTFQKKKEAAPEERQSAAVELSESASVKTEEKVPKTPREPADPELVKKRAETFLKEIFRTMDMDVSIEMEFEEDALSVNITGEEMGLLIGKRGQTLDSLQYLTSLVVNKGNAAYVRVKLDTEDYRNRRRSRILPEISR